MLIWKAVDMEIPRKSSSNIFTDTVKGHYISSRIFFWGKGESDGNLGKNRQ